MITNSKLTVYHNGMDYSKHEETWTRFNYDNVWWFGGKGTSTNKGYENANDIDIRIPYDKNDNLSPINFDIGDIVVGQELDIDIKTQSDLDNYEVYNITAINNNFFGNNKHIHLSGK